MILLKIKTLLVLVSWSQWPWPRQWSYLLWQSQDYCRSVDYTRSAWDAYKVIREEIQKSNFCFENLLTYFNSVTLNLNNETIKMGWLLHCDTGSLREHKPFVTCSISLSQL